MARSNITYLLVALVVISGIFSIFTLFILKYDEAYTQIDLDDTTLPAYNHTQELFNKSNQLKNSTLSITQPTGVLDLIGGIFTSGYSVLTSIPQILTIFYKILDQALIDLGLGDAGNTIRMVIITCFVIIIFVGIILAIVLNRQDEI